MIIYKPAKEFTEMIRKVEATSVDIIKKHLAQIKKHNNALNGLMIGDHEFYQTCSGGAVCL